MSDEIRDPLRKARPVIQALLSGGGHKTPYLADYLADAGKLPNRVLQNLMIGCLGISGGIAALGISLLLLIKGEPQAAAGVFFGYPVLCAAGTWLVGKLRRPRSARDHRQIEVRRAAQALKPLVAKRRLAKSLGSATATLLEEAAQLRHRALSSLDGPFWTDAMLPAHWQAVREQAIDAIEDAMGDLMLLAEPSLRPDSGKADWQEMVGGLLGMPEAAENEILPPMFGTARQIVQKLQLLAGQVEEATRQVISEKPAGEVGQSAASLDACLSELKSIQQAESELHQSQGN